MSRIAGVWNFDGRPLQRDVLCGMAAAFMGQPGDGGGVHVSGSFGLTQHRLCATVGDLAEQQPLVAREGIALAMDGRLHNRAELAAHLGLPKEASDAACVLAAYRRWSDECVSHFNGDFAGAIFDERSQTLVLMRDSIGVRPLYYTRTDCFIAFASEIKALLAHPEVSSTPDDEGVADYLLISSRPIDRQDITCFAGISALVPAHVAIVTADRLLTRRYWDFDTGRSLRFASFGDYVEGFRETFGEAVRRRTRSAYPIAISVSGGFDSSSLFCEAETRFRQGGAEYPGVVGITYTGPAGTEADEVRYIAALEQHCGVPIERIDSRPLMSLVRNASDQLIGAEAPFIDYLWGLTDHLHRAAAGRGARVLLTGHWGDQVLFSSAYLVDLFRRLSWFTIVEHTREYQRWFGIGETRSLVRRFVTDICRHYAPKPLIPPLKRLRRRMFRIERPKAWFSDRFLSRALRFADEPATIGEGFHSAHAQALYLEARSKYHVHCLEWHNKIGARYGLEPAFPYLDRDLLSFLMAIPGEVHAPDGKPRQLAREAMRAVLPPVIYERKSKGDFSGFVNGGVAQDVDVLRSVLSRDCVGVTRGFLDPERLERAVSELASGLNGADCLDGWDLADAFGLELWLRLFFDPQRELTARPATGEGR